MFELLSLLQLQQYWWILVSLLAGLFVFLMFVQGGQTFIKTLPDNDEESLLIVNSLGRKWELTFATLVMLGGALFAAFPIFYATSFSGAYWLWVSILFCFIIQAVSYEYRIKKGNFLGKDRYETLLLINGFMGTFLIGVAVATFFSGSRFLITPNNSIVWQSSLCGLESIINIFNISLGLTVVFLARVLGLMYFLNNISNDKLIEKVFKSLKINSIIFVVLFLAFAAQLILSSGFAVNPDSKIVYFEDYKYLHNLIQMPLFAIVFVVGVVLVLLGIALSIFKKSTKGIWFSGAGTVLTVFALVTLAGLNNTSFYPSSTNLQSSLTIENSSSSKYTLTVMSYVTLIIPVVLAYIFYVWKKMDAKKIDIEELTNTPEAY